MNLLLLIMNMVLFVNILIPLSTAQQCKNCGKGNVAAKRIKMLNKSTFTRIAGVELDNIFQITPEKNMTVCAQRCDANLTCTVFEFNKPHKLCLLSTSYAVIDPDLVSNAFATAIFVKITGTFAKKLPKGPESCLSRDEYSDYLITNVTAFLKNGTQPRNDTTPTSNGATNLPSTPPSESTSAASAASSTQGAEINHGTSGTTPSDMETTSTPTDSDAPADSATYSDAVTVEEEKATTASGLSPAASKMPTAHVETSETIRDTTTTQKPSTVSPTMSSSSTSATETTKIATTRSTSSGATTSSLPLQPSDPASSSSVTSSEPTVPPTPTSSSKASSTSADLTTPEAQKEPSVSVDSSTYKVTEEITSEQNTTVVATTIGETGAEQSTTSDGSTAATKMSETPEFPSSTQASVVTQKFRGIPMPSNVKCVDDWCWCPQGTYLFVTTKAAFYSGLKMKVDSDGKWYMFTQGTKSFLMGEDITSVGCPFLSSWFNQNGCQLPSVKHGSYGPKELICPGGFKRAYTTGGTVSDASVLICYPYKGFTANGASVTLTQIECMK